LKKSADRWQTRGHRPTTRVPRVVDGISRLTPVAEKFGAFRSLERELASARDMQDDNDPACVTWAARNARLAPEIERAEDELKSLLIPRDPRDDKNIYLEVRAGTGGDEARSSPAICSACMRATPRRTASPWKSCRRMLGEHGGYREIISRIAVPARSRASSSSPACIACSACRQPKRKGASTPRLAPWPFLPRPTKSRPADLNPAELRVDTFRASGAGGQHVNKTDSAIRITHLPTGLVVECQDERSQHKNRSRAMALMKAKLLAAEQEKRDSEIARDRKLQVGTGRSLRTHPHLQLSAGPRHRPPHQSHALQARRHHAGPIDELLDALQHEHQAEQLAEEEQRGRVSARRRRGRRTPSCGARAHRPERTGVDAPIVLAGPARVPSPFLIDWLIRTALDGVPVSPPADLRQLDLTIDPTRRPCGTSRRHAATAIYFLYHLISSRYGGRTPGKRIPACACSPRRLVPTTGALLTRNVFRIIVPCRLLVWPVVRVLHQTASASRRSCGRHRDRDGARSVPRESSARRGRNGMRFDGAPRR
jgi:peptide chain release factor 1